MTAPIEPGDVVVLYTDGVTEALNKAGRQLGLERVQQALARASAGASAAGDAIVESVRRHAADCDQSDDITIICFSRT